MTQQHRSWVGCLPALTSADTRVQAHPAVFRRLLDKSEGQRSEWEYPFGAAGVNLTFLLQACCPCACATMRGLEGACMVATLGLALNPKP